MWYKLNVAIFMYYIIGPSPRLRHLGTTRLRLDLAVTHWVPVYLLRKSSKHATFLSFAPKPQLWRRDPVLMFISSDAASFPKPRYVEKFR